MPDLITKTVILSPGETFTFPPGANIIFSSDSGALESDCVVPPSGSYRCGYFFLILDADENPDHSMDIQTKYAYVKIGDVQYNLNIVVTYGDGNHPSFTSVSTLNSLLPDTALFEFKAITTGETNKRVHAHVYFTVVDSFYDSTFLAINNKGFDSISLYPPKTAVCDSYEDPS